MGPMIDDEQVYREMGGPASPEDIAKMQLLLRAWAIAADELGEANDLRTVFLACVNTLNVMGPAYCRLAAVTLLQWAGEI